jgi:hypothetical protein
MIKVKKKKTSGSFTLFRVIYLNKTQYNLRDEKH